MTNPENPPAPPAADYPGFDEAEVAAARLAAAARALAYFERELPVPEQKNPDPVSKALSYYLTLREHGYDQPDAQVEVILMSYFDAAGRAIADEMAGNFEENVSRFVSLAMMEYIGSRMIPEQTFEEDKAEDPDAVYAVDPEDEKIANTEYGGE